MTALYFLSFGLVLLGGAVCLWQEWKAYQREWMK